jgi:hypothetical protein
VQNSLKSAFLELRPWRWHCRGSPNSTLKNLKLNDSLYSSILLYCTYTMVHGPKSYDLHALILVENEKSPKLVPAGRPASPDIRFTPWPLYNLSVLTSHPTSPLSMTSVGLFSLPQTVASPYATCNSGHVNVNPLTGQGWTINWIYFRSWWKVADLFRKSFVVHAFIVVFFMHTLFNMLFSKISKIWNF